jgi:DNA-directed RNA polymerase subunit N (RpoN/RPB10)
MLIPVRCYSCGKVVADLWRYYQRALGEDIAEDSPESAALRAKVLDELGLTRACCRRMLLSQPPRDLIFSL